MTFLRPPKRASRRRVEKRVGRYLNQLDSADRQEPSLGRTTRPAHLKDGIAKLRAEMQRLAKLEGRMLGEPDQQISLTDPDARSMATSGRGSGVVGYNVQAAVDTKHHLIVAHQVTNVGADRAQLSAMAKQTKAALESDGLDVVADRGYFNGEEIPARHDDGITVTLEHFKFDRAPTTKLTFKRPGLYSHRLGLPLASRRIAADAAIRAIQD